MPAMGNVLLKANSDGKHELFSVIDHNLRAVAFPGLYVLSFIPTPFRGCGANLLLESLLLAVSFIHACTHSFIDLYIH